MRRKTSLILILTLVIIAACQPNIAEPKFTTSFETNATPIPMAIGESRIIASLPGRIHSFAISPNEKTIAIATSRGIVLYDLETFELIRNLKENESSFKVAWSPDGKKLAAANIVMETKESGKSHLLVWDASNWQPIFEQMGSDDTLNSIYGNIAWSPNDRFLATSIDAIDGVLVYDTQSSKIISHQETLSSMGIFWSPDGSRLVATGDLAYGIRRWKVSTNESVRLFDQRASSSMQIAWSPDGMRIASGHAEGTVCFWTAMTNKCDGFIKAHRTAVFSLAWSPNGDRLATGGGVIRIWDTHTGKLVTSFAMSDTSIYTHLEWPGTGKVLASAEIGYEDEEATFIRFWDVKTGKVLFEFQGAKGVLGN